MIKFFPVLGLTLLLASCGSEDKKENSEVKSVDSVTKQTVKDTITFTLDDIDKNAYCKLVDKSGYCDKNNKLGWKDDSLQEVKLIEKYARIVSRNGDRLSFLVGKNNLDFKDVRDEMSGEYIIYRLLDMNDEYAVLAMMYYEGHEYMVLNHKTGKSFKTWGRPIFNVTRTMVVSGNYDLAAGYSNNGFQVFANENGKWNLKMERLLDDWGPEDLWWVNDSVVAGKKMWMYETKNGSTRDTAAFVKINLKTEIIN
ncbi:MAG TPA: hypothetical protein VK177_13815 [Flavobacteriales bacterium]|nr:hypothetical protein [Flavobacteriales bacterium]